MAWLETEIVVSGETVNGGINSRDESATIEIPFQEGVEVGGKVTVGDDDFTIVSIDNLGGRDETLSLEVTNDKPVSRRTGNKSKRQEVSDEDDG